MLYLLYYKYYHISKMPKPNYIKLNLSDELTQEVFEIGNWIRDNNDFQFEPMEYDGIHMTIAFLGNIMKGKKIETDIETLINKFPFEKYQNMNITFAGYDLFPESKKNLIVARFNVSQQFTDDVIKFQKEFCKFGVEQDRYYFAPHITIGKIMHKNEKTKIDLTKIPLITEQFVPTGFSLV
jgi:2'-5' RNA ligase